jgi:hypothetical protein
MARADNQTADELVPDDVIPHGHLPPLRYRDLPPPVPVAKMIGPSLILAGLALGSGELIIWPYITYKSQFVFFWAALLGVATQYFINMEITRWTLATGESAITGFARLSRHWASVFLVLNIVPWILPAWATGAAEIATWLFWEPNLSHDAVTGKIIIEPSRYVVPIAIGTMFLCGILLTAGPVIYETVERVQTVLVASILILVVVLAVWLYRPDAVAAQARAVATLGAPDFVPRPKKPEDFDSMLLLGALAFAGAGGTLNLGQSNYVKDKGYGMGRYIGRITSPITGKEEPVAEIGYHFPHTAENLARWRTWWRAASLEHFVSFFATCVLCLVLLTLISYVIFYDSQGRIKPGLENFGRGTQFLLAEAREIGTHLGQAPKILFFVMGIAILFTTELGVLDAASRISTDIVKVNWLRENQRWTEGRLYYLFLWGTILAGSLILLVQNVWRGRSVESLDLFKATAAMNGGVMFFYSGLLLYLNRRALPAVVRMRKWRALILVWSVLFFGFFTVWAAGTLVAEVARSMRGG